MVVTSVVNFLMMNTIDFLRYCRGFGGKNVQIDQFDWSYMERDAQEPDTTEPVVFIHGFSSSKESWINVASRIDRKYQVIVPDLPGQGRTTPADPNETYAIDVQAERLHKFFEQTIPADRKVHLVGCSMGGLLAGSYSAIHPERVRSVTMICPAGITMPNKSDAYTLLDQGKNVLLAETPEDLMDMFNFIGYKPVKVPRFLASVISRIRSPQIPVFQKILDDSIISPTFLEDRLHLIKAKSLVFWGKNDRVLDISSLPILEEKLVNASEKHVFVFDECGHTVQHEKYQEVVKAVNLFLDGHTPQV